MLHEEHVHALAVLDALESRVTGRAARRTLDPADDADQRLVSDLVAVLGSALSRHFAFEEGVVFPIAADQGAGDMVIVLIQEHGAIMAAAASLRRLAAAACRQGLDAADWSAFRESALDLIGRSTAHIQKEEMAIIQRLGQLVGADGLRRLASEYASFQQRTPQ